MSDNLKISEAIITDKIYIIRNQKVMLDRDLASLYGVETRVLNQAVKRNITRFPDDFMFEVSKEELDNLISQIVTSSWGGTRKLPFAFTEHGVMMLSSVLKSDKAIQTNIQIMRTFTKVKQMLLDTSELKINILQIQKKLENHDKNIELVFSYLDELNEKKEDEKPRVKIGYKK
ncbi:MAG TPA: DNA-binding protein [Flavobacterium sp.]|nr:DNA-binding protein [Flavobacterium sp.]